MGLPEVPWSAVLVAALAAVGFALSSSLQHVAAGTMQHRDPPAHRLVALLARRPLWLLGQVLAGASFGLHALALHLGTLALVQPVVVSGVVLSVPVRAFLVRRRPLARELVTVAVTMLGLCLLLLAAKPCVGATSSSQWPSVVVTASGVLAAAALVQGARRCRSRARAALLFGVAAGVLFGLVAGLVKITTSMAASSPHPLEIATSWTSWAVVVLGLAGVVTTQRGYHAARMSATLPALNVTDVAVAVLFGVFVFHEIPAHDPRALAGELLGVLLIGVGLRRLSSGELVIHADREPVGAGPAHDARRHRSSTTEDTTPRGKGTP